MHRRPPDARGGADTGKAYAVKEHVLPACKKYAFTRPASGLKAFAAQMRKNQRSP